MADLQEALAAREKRSRITAIIIGVVVIAIVAFIIFRIAQNNSSSNDVTEDTTQEEVVAPEETTEGGVDLDELFSGTDETATDESSATDVADDDTATEDEAEETPAPAPSRNVATATGDDLPNTGPTENAIIGILAIGIIGGLYAQSRVKLAEAQTK